MKKKTILITGASDGIGKETARTLAKQGHIIIMHGRNKDKTRAAYEEIKQATGNDQIEMFIADFLSLSDIKRFTNELNHKYDHLDVLINNAGAQFTDKKETTAEGHEKTMTINLLAPFLLTTLLMELLKNSKSARVITVSSSSHSMSGQPDLDDIELEKGYSMGKAYTLSKLYVIWIMQHFVKQVTSAGIDNITFNTVHPGAALTNLGREAKKSLKWRIIYFISKPFTTTVAMGASSSIKAAISPELEGVMGKYYGPKGEEKASQKYYSQENEQKVWDYCLKIAQPYL